jgi:hypothetical protein
MEKESLILGSCGERTVHLRVGRAEFEYAWLHGRFPGKTHLRASAVTFYPHPWIFLGLENITTVRGCAQQRGEDVFDDGTNVKYQQSELTSKSLA